MKAVSKDNLILLPKHEYLEQVSGRVSYIDQYWLTSQDGGIAFFVSALRGRTATGFPAPQCNRNEYVVKTILKSIGYPEELSIRKVDFALVQPLDDASYWAAMREKYNMAALENPTAQDMQAMRLYHDHAQTWDGLFPYTPEILRILSGPQEYLDSDMAKLVRAAKMAGSWERILEHNEEHQPSCGMQP